MRTNKAAYISLFTVLASRLCCIIPFIAIVSGIAGGATLFSFIEPYRPYLFLISASILGFGFYQEYNPKDMSQLRPCCNENTEKKSKLNRKILWTVAITSTLLFSFPYYSGIFIKTTNATAMSNPTYQKIELQIEGMSCQGCGNNIMLNLSKINGIKDSEVAFETKKANITFEPGIISEKQIIQSIEEIGFTVKK